MKVNYGSEKSSVAIEYIPVGGTFFANRKSVKAKGLYMKIDSTSGLVKRKADKIYAINLETGQPREFDRFTLVDKVEAEVIFPKRG